MGNLAAGKRNLLINDVSGAVGSFAEACKMMGEIYGETAAECGESFFYYGKALLEMARMENGVLENGLGGGKSNRLVVCNSTKIVKYCMHVWIVVAVAPFEPP